MNIKITYNWLLDYLETNATPFEIQKYLSLCGPAIERVDKNGDDYVFDIEITSNRIDCASVIGIAQECQAILPLFGKKAKIKNNPLTEYSFKNQNVKNKINELEVIIKNPDNCSRFTVVLAKNINVTKPNKTISERLEMCDIKSINNIVDISNYIMLTLGQPTHFFDYDQIKSQKMILRDAKDKEEMITLDNKKINLSSGDIVIEDGSGRIIDLCGIMGGLNSSISEKTKNVLIFIQNYDKTKIRKTSMTTSQRTVACTYFEKGLDSERVEPACVYAIELMKKYVKLESFSDILDIYPTPYKTKNICINFDFINKKIGVKIDKKQVVEILENLGFKIAQKENDLEIEIPSFRAQDINIKEDIIEEIARIYGYFNIPSIPQLLPNQIQPEELKNQFYWEQKIKYFLKHLGFFETYNYSMISEKQITQFEEKIHDYIKIKNSISQEIEYMRKELIISLLENFSQNEAKKDSLNLFEIARTYHKNGNGLPNEIVNLIIASNSGYFELKGIVEALFKELNINNKEIKINSLNLKIQNNFKIKKPIFYFEIELNKLLKDARKNTIYKQINQFAKIKLDKTFEIKKEGDYKKITSNFTHPLLEKFEIISEFKNKITIRFYLSNKLKNITEKEAQTALEEILNK